MHLAFIPKNPTGRWGFMLFDSPDMNLSDGEPLLPEHVDEAVLEILNRAMQDAIDEGQAMIQRMAEASDN